jgi:hypothetical protein
MMIDYESISPLQPDEDYGEYVRYKNFGPAPGDAVIASNGTESVAGYLVCHLKDVDGEIDTSVYRYIVVTLGKTVKTKTLAGGVGYSAGMYRDVQKLSSGKISAKRTHHIIGDRVLYSETLEYAGINYRGEVATRWRGCPIGVSKYCGDLQRLGVINRLVKPMDKKGIHVVYSGAYGPLVVSGKTLCTEEDIATLNNRQRHRLNEGKSIFK